MKVLLLSLLAAFAASAQTVFVDMADLVKRHPQTAKDKAQLEQSYRELETKVEGLKAVIDKMTGEFETAVKAAQNPALSANAKTQAENTAVEKRRLLLEKDRQATEEIQLDRGHLAEQEESCLERTMKEIRNTIEIVAKKKGYKMVLPKNMAVYMDPGLDITAEIAKAMGFDDKAE